MRAEIIASLTSNKYLDGSRNLNYMPRGFVEMFRFGDDKDWMWAHTYTTMRDCCLEVVAGEYEPKPLMELDWLRDLFENANKRTRLTKEEFDFWMEVESHLPPLHA
jgi:hypothetical protein